MWIRTWLCQVLLNQSSIINVPNKHFVGGAARHATSHKLYHSSSNVTQLSSSLFCNINLQSPNCRPLSFPRFFTAAQGRDPVFCIPGHRGPFRAPEGKLLFKSIFLMEAGFYARPCPAGVSTNTSVLVPMCFDVCGRKMSWVIIFDSV